MASVDAGLLEGRPLRVAVVPTAASLEGDERVAWWLDLARRHYGAMGVEAVPVPVLTRADADDRRLASLVDGVGLVYLSGGDPHHLAATLKGSRVWEAVVAAWHGGAALAGCSAGAMALTSGAPPDLGPGGSRRALSGEAPGAGPAERGPEEGGLEVVGHLAVIPHFDLLERRRPGVVEWFASWQRPGTTLVGERHSAPRRLARGGAGGGVGLRLGQPAALRPGGRRPPGGAPDLLSLTASAADGRGAECRSRSSC